MFERKITPLVFSFVMQSKRFRQSVVVLAVRVTGALLSLGAGWLFYLGIVFVMSPNCRRILSESGFGPALSKAFHIAARGALAAGLVAVVANIVFALVYLLAPRDWRIWRWRVAAMWGLAGGAVFGLVIPLLYHQPPMPGISLFTAPTGGFTCLIAALINSKLEKGIA